MGILGTLGNVLAGAAPIIGGAVGGVPGSLVGAAIGGVASGMSNDDSIQAQREYAKYQAELEQVNWEKRFNMQNEYNDPSALRKRLENAGMNPNLAYGSLSPNMASNPSAGTPSGQLSKYQNAVESAVSLQQLALAQQNTKADIELKEAETEVARAEKKRKDAETGSIERQNDLTDLSWNYLMQIPEKQVRYLSNHADSFEWDYEMKKKYYELEDEMRHKEFDLDVEWKSNQALIGFMNAAALQKSSDAAMVQALATRDLFYKQGIVLDETAEGLRLDNQKLWRFLNEGKEVNIGELPSGTPLYQFVTWDRLMNKANLENVQSQTAENWSNASGQNSLRGYLTAGASIIGTMLLARYSRIGKFFGKTPKPKKNAVRSQSF